MSDEEQPRAEKIDAADLELALDELESGEETDPAGDVVAAMAAMIDGVRKGVA
jgi:hypothetical protein